MTRACRAAFATLAVALVVLFPVAPSHAQSVDPIVWVDKRVSLQGRRVSVVQPVVNQSKFEIPQEALAEIRQALESALSEKGLLVDKSVAAPSPQALQALQVQAAVLWLKRGDPVAQWIGLGLGAATCTIRVQLLDPSSMRYVADMVQSRVVDGGGILTLGVANSMHRDIAAELAEVIATLLKGGG